MRKRREVLGATYVKLSVPQAEFVNYDLLSCGLLRQCLGIASRLLVESQEPGDIDIFLEGVDHSSRPGCGSAIFHDDDATKWRRDIPLSPLLTQCNNWGKKEEISRG